MNKKISKANLLDELGKIFFEVCRSKFPDKPAENLKNRFRKIFNGFHDGYFEVDLEGNYIYANPTVCEYHDKTLDQLIGTSSLTHIPRRARKKIIQMCNQVSRQEIPTKIEDCQFVLKDGTTVSMDLYIAMIKDENGKSVGFRGIARDRTQAKLNQLELRRYQEFVESIDDGCFETDIDGSFTFVNKAMSQIHGYSRQELIGMNHRDFAPPEESKNIFKVFNIIYKTGIPHRVFDYNIATKNKEARNLEVSASLIHDSQGVAIGFRGISRDRTEKKVQELELERYRNFVENVEDPCFEVDLKGNFTFFNKAACRVYGYPAEKLMGMNNREYTDPETAQRLYDEFSEIYKTGRPANIFDYEIRRSDGQIRCLNMSASLIHDAKGAPVGFRGICKDVTDQKNAQEENERLTALLNEAKRLEATATLAAGVAHNFNNLLMSIQGYVSLLGMNLEPDHPDLKRLNIIENHIKKGSELTFQLLSYANVNYNPANKVNINDIIRSSVAVFKMTHKQIKITEQYVQPIQEVVVDRKQIEHVLMNLLKNSVQAMPDGGSLYIETDNVKLEEDFVKAYDRNAGPYVKITVTDTGVGMDKITQERIFEPFFTTQNLGMATGLGLAAVYGVIKKHLGIIDVNSEKNQGTTFTIYLPAKAELSESEKAPTAVDLPEETILIVDDEEVFVKLMTKMVEKMGYSTLSALNGHDALELFRINKNSIKLVLLDMIMPGISGDQLIEMLQGIDPDVRVILVSGYIKDDSMKNITAQRHRAFLQKPFQREDLVETIENLLAD